MASESYRVTKKMNVRAIGGGGCRRGAGEFGTGEQASLD